MNEEKSRPHRENTRQEIISAAHLLFLAHGFHGTSMRQIARQAGIALGGIYNHFESKEAIFLAVLDTYHPYQYVLPALQGAEGEKVEEYVRDAAWRMVAGLGEQSSFLNLMFIELVEFKGQHVPAMMERILPQVLLFAQRFLQYRQELRPIPIPILVRSFIGLFFSYGITDLLVANMLPAEMRENSFEHFLDIYLHGILNYDEHSPGFHHPQGIPPDPA
jgi:AcrR family transcriptional regulator